MSDFDVFNGDADGICALTQLRLAEPRKDARLVTGVKRDIELLGQVEGRAGDRVTVLDVSLDKNRTDVQRLLTQGVEIFYVDHHFAGEIPQGLGLIALINEAPDVCTSLLVNGHLKNRYLAWAVTGAFGDNLTKSAKTLARSLELTEAQLRQLEELGTYTIAMLKDEAHHLLNVSSAAADQDRMANQLDALKVVVNESKVRLVLFGGAKLAKACMINGHFKTRAHTIIVGAYDGSIKADRNEFHRLVQEAMVEYEVNGYDAKDFDTTVAIMNRVQGLIGWFWESIEKSKRMHKASLTLANVLAGLPSPIGMESVIAEVDAVRELENQTHPMSDDQFVNLTHRTDVVAPAAAKPAVKSPKAQGKGQAAPVGKRGDVRDPACSFT